MSGELISGAVQWDIYPYVETASAGMDDYYGRRLYLFMWTRSELKDKGKEAFKANYWRCVLCGVLLMFALGSFSLSSRSSGSNGGTDGTQQSVEYINNATPEQQTAIAIVAATVFGIVSVAVIVSLVLKIFLFNPLTVGCYGFFKENVNDHNTTLGVLSSGFSNFFHVFATLFLRDLFLTLWTLLFIIPGFVKMYSYRMVPYILRDNPELSATEVITRSRMMMNGNKMDAFVLDLSFFGWYLLGIFTFGLGLIFWTQPYHQSTNAALYLAIKDNTQGYAA